MSACMGLSATRRQADFESQIETIKTIECANAFRQLITYLCLNDSNRLFKISIISELNKEFPVI